MLRPAFIATLLLFASACSRTSADTAASDLNVPGGAEQVAPGSAAEPAVAEPAADESAPAPAHAAKAHQPGQDYRFMIGEWKVTETLQPEKAGATSKGTGTMVGVPGPSPSSVLVDYRSETGPMTGFAMHTIVSWDHEQNFFQTYVSNFEPTAATEVGTYVDGEYVMEREVVGEDGTTFISRGVVSDISDEGFVMESFLGPKEGPMVKVLRLEAVRAD